MRLSKTAPAALALAALCFAWAAPASEAELDPTAEDMVAVPAATLPMGCNPARDPSCSDGEQPQHAVDVAAFRIDRFEVTQADYARCLAAAACTEPAAGFDPEREPRRPVVEVTWEQAETYCVWAGKRLPSEAEWELAARGTDERIFPWGDEPPTCARAHTHDCGDGPADVGERPDGVSPFGVHDMAGNVDEWVADAWRSYAAPADSASSHERVARGGAWDAWHSRTTARSALDPAYHDAWLGFRCARSQP